VEQLEQLPIEVVQVDAQVVAVAGTEQAPRVQLAVVPLLNELPAKPTGTQTLDVVAAVVGNAVVVVPFTVLVTVFAQQYPTVVHGSVVAVVEHTIAVEDTVTAWRNLSSFMPRNWAETTARPTAMKVATLNILLKI
jgi:hypothetical protein